jgi:peroxiredoxin
MNLGRCLAFLLLPMLSLVIPANTSAQTTASSVGKKIEAFALPDPAGKVWSLADLKGKKAVVVLFIGSECPINKAYMPRLAELSRKFELEGVQFVAINANVHENPARIRDYVREHKVPFSVLMDVNQKTADLFGAQRTPEAFVLDQSRVIRYQGRIDDQFGLGFQRPQPRREDLALALADVLAGRAVGVPSTPVAGCIITREARPKEKVTVTYTKNVAPILQKNCQECHRPGQIGPMPLLSYNDAAVWAIPFGRSSKASVCRPGTLTRSTASSPMIAACRRKIIRPC